MSMLNVGSEMILEFNKPGASVVFNFNFSHS